MYIYIIVFCTNSKKYNSKACRKVINIMIKKAKKIVAMMMVMLLALSGFANAGSGSATKSHNGSVSRLKFDVSFSFPSMSRAKVVGTSSMVWAGSSPYNADSIQLTNTFRVTAVGGVSFSSTGGGFSTSGNTMADSMSVSNAFICASSFTYYATAAIITRAYYSVTGRTQIGNHFYTISL